MPALVTTVRLVVICALACMGLSACAGGGADSAADVPDPAFDVPAVSDPSAASEASAWPVPGVVLVVVIDTLRADHLGAYGAPSNQTPALDALAARSLVFEQATATSSWTRSSIASMLTSRYPGSLHVLDRDDAIAPDALTIAEVLAARGWRTVGVFSNGNASPEIGFAQGFAEARRPQLVRGYPGDFQKYTAEGVTNEATAALRAWRDEGERAPLFLFVHYIDPHDPYLPHPELMPGTEPPGRFSGARPDLDRLDRLGASRRTADDVARIAWLYAGEVRYCDRWVGRLLDELAGIGAARDALVVVTADHGEGLWDHDKRGHGTDLYQEQIRVPLLVHYPGMTAASAGRVTEPISLVDLAPTILAAVGVGRPEAFEGHDLGPLTRGHARAPGLTPVYAEMDLDGRSFEALRVGPTKLVRRRDSSWRAFVWPRELYRLDADPHETHDLARVAGERGLVRRLDLGTKRWAGAIAARGAALPAAPVRSLSPEVEKQLRGLGYLR